MIPGGAVLLAASLFSFAPVGNVELGAEVRAGTNWRLVQEQGLATQEGPLPPEVIRSIGELDLAPRLELSNDTRLRVSLAYAPTLRVPFEPRPEGLDPRISAPGPLQRASLLHSLELRLDRELSDWTLRGRAFATYGSMDPLGRDVFAPPREGERPGTSAGSQPVLRTDRIGYRSFGASAGFTTLPWRSATLSIDGSASVGGGTDREAAEVMPLQRELGADGRLEFQLGYENLLGVEVSAVDSTVAEGSDALLLRFGSSWTRILNRFFTLRFAGGAVGADVTTPPEPLPEGERGSSTRAVSAAPWGQVALEYLHSEVRPSLALIVGAEPTIDRLRGALDYRTFVEGRSAWSPGRDWLLGATGQVAYLDPWLGYDDIDYERTWIAGMALRADRSLTRDVTMGVVVAAAVQHSGRADLLNFREVVTMVELRAVLPGSEPRAAAAR